MEISNVCKLHGIFGGSSTVTYCTEGLSSRKVEFAGEDGEWDTYSDGKIAYRRRVTEIRGSFYKVENVWKNISDEAVTLFPLLQPTSMDRYTETLIPGKNGENLEPPLVYGAPPVVIDGKDMKYPGMTISVSHMQTMGLFTDSPKASCFFTKSWEGKAYHWLLFPLQTMQPGDTFSGNAYLSSSDPSVKHPGPEEVYARADEILNG